MKNVYYYIKESLLDDEDEVFDGTKESIIKTFLEENYNIDGSYTIKEIKHKFIVDVKGNIRVKNKDITSFTNELFEFGSIGGKFDCYYCEFLTSLEGAPEKVGGDFDCSCCKSLTSLKGAPKEVGGKFDCGFCKLLKTFEGAPKEVRGNFVCEYCEKLTSLKGAPKKVDGDFKCFACISLETLEGAPKEVGGGFYCAGCYKLKDLKGAPKEVERFDCSNCKSLKSLEGAPKCTVIAAYNCGKSYGKDDIIKYTGATYKMTRSGSRVKLN